MNCAEQSNQNVSKEKNYYCIYCCTCAKTVNPVEALQQPTSALVANAKRCHILSVAAHRPIWRVGCNDCTQLMTLTLNGWRHTAHKCTWQQQQLGCITGSVQLADQGQHACVQLNQTSSLQWISVSLLPGNELKVTVCGSSSWRQLLLPY